MKEKTYGAFCRFREDLKNQIENWQSDSGLMQELVCLQKEAAEKDGVPAYELEHPLVYNRALDEIGPEDEIKLIVIGDNPGKDEQRDRNQRYLVGQAGKIAEGFFRRNAELGIDFRKNAVILNKTPLHTAKTKELDYLIKNGSAAVKELVYSSQKWMAEKTAELHMALNEEEECGLWLVGYSELKGKGLFLDYKKTLCGAYGESEAFGLVSVFQHFSMNRFSIDLAEYAEKHRENSLEQNIRELGAKHRSEIFGAETL